MQLISHWLNAIELVRDLKPVEDRHVINERLLMNVISWKVIWISSDTAHLEEAIRSRAAGSLRNTNDIIKPFDIMMMVTIDYRLVYQSVHQLANQWVHDLQKPR